MDEALGDEPAEQPLHDAMLQVQVDHLVVHRAGVLEDDGPDRRGPPPLPELLLALSGARRVSIVSAQVGSAPSRWSMAGNSAPRPVRRPAPSTGLSGSAPISSKAHEMAERKWSSSRPMLFCDSAKPRAELVDLLAQVVLTLAGRLQFLLDGLPLVGVQVGRFDVLLHRVDPVAADALLQRVGQAGVDDLGQAAQLLLDRLRLADQRR